MDLDNNNHSVFKMKYQLLLMINKLHPILTQDISDRLKEIFENISPRYNISISVWKYQEDRLDIIFFANPNTELSKFINAYKSAASRLIKKEFPQITDKLHNGQFWSRTFCLLTLEHNVSEGYIKAFIEKHN